MRKRNAGILGTLLLLVLGTLSVILGTDFLSLAGLDSEPPVFQPAPPADEPEDWYEIYFTNPTCPPGDERGGGLDQIVADSFADAELRIDVAAFDLDAPPIIDALIAAEARGVQVRVVTDADNGDLSGVRRLRRGGISVIEDDRSGLMHNKFVVIDGRFTWVGSMNFTTNGAYCNNNNLVRFESARLAANYTAEMDEMVAQRAFGPDSPVNTPGETLQIHGVTVQNYFGPEKEIAPIIARIVAGAQESIQFMAFSFTDERLGETILGRADAGVTVQGVFETAGAETAFSTYPLMRDAGLPNLDVRLDGNPRIMHHKVIIVDSETVIFGSFNFSDSANDRNDENILIIDDLTFTSFFVEEFEAVWGEASP